MALISPKATREDIIAMVNNRDALVSDLKDRVAELEGALRHAQDAVFWHSEAGKFEINGKTATDVIDAAFINEPKFVMPSAKHYEVSYAAEDDE